MKEPSMAPENDFGPRQETCVCGQQIQWYPSVSREAVVVLFHKNFSFSHRFEFHVPPRGLVEFECVRCLEPLSVRASRCTTLAAELRPTVAIPPEFLEFSPPEGVLRQSRETTPISRKTKA
jgi:hypothetical protein